MPDNKQNLESFRSYFPQFIQAIKNKDHEFLKKIYPGEFFKLMKGDETYDFSMLGTEWILSEFDNKDVTFQCNGNKCTATHNEDIFELNFVDGQWLGYDPEEAKKWQKMQEKMAQFKYEYQISFADFGPAKYQVLLNGAPIKEMENYQTTHTLSFVPYDIKMGENILKISAQIDTSSPDYKEGDKQTITLSYEIFRFPKGNKDPMALFDKSNTLIKSGGEGSVSGMEDIEIGNKGFAREVKFSVE